MRDICPPPDIASIYTPEGRGISGVTQWCPSATRLHIGKLSAGPGPRDRCDAAIPRRRSRSGLSPSNFLDSGERGERHGANGEGGRGSKELREVEVKMAGADGAKIGPLFAF